MDEMVGKTYNEDGTSQPPPVNTTAACSTACLDDTNCDAARWRNTPGFCTTYNSSQPHMAIDSTNSDAALDAVFEKHCK
jgi:hypothetical protein